MEIVVGIMIAFILIGIIKAINGDDGSKWPHNETGKWWK